MAKRKPGRPTSPEAIQASPCEESPRCHLSPVFRLLGRSHVLDVLHLLTDIDTGPWRFVDMQARLSLSPNTLADRLKELAAIGLVTRTVYDDVPPRVEYQATAKALELAPLLSTLDAWWDRNEANAARDGAAGTAASG